MILKNIENTIIDLMINNNLKVYYDIGASLTRKTITLFNALIKNGISIYAFEPHPILYQELKQQFSNEINIYNLGVGNLNKTATLYSIKKDLYLSSFSHEFIIKKTGEKEFDEHECSIVRLDEFIKENNLPAPDLIKVDTEDWEDKVFESIPLNLTPVLLAEYHSYNVRLNVEDILRFKYDQNIFFQYGTKNTVRYFVYTSNKKEYVL